jgi:hypothetical protein
MTQYIHIREKSKEEEEMKGKNITKLPLCMYCVRKSMSNYHFLGRNHNILMPIDDLHHI